MRRTARSDRPWEYLFLCYAYVPFNLHETCGTITCAATTHTCSALCEDCASDRLGQVRATFWLLEASPGRQLQPMVGQVRMRWLASLTSSLLNHRLAVDAIYVYLLVYLCVCVCQSTICCRLLSSERLSLWLWRILRLFFCLHLFCMVMHNNTSIYMCIHMYIYMYIRCT